MELEPGQRLYLVDTEIKNIKNWPERTVPKWFIKARFTLISVLACNCVRIRYTNTASGESNEMDMHRSYFGV